MGSGLSWWFKVWPYVSLVPIPHSGYLSFLGLPGLPFCHQANLMSGPHSYGPARETNSCTEGEASGNISSLPALLELALKEKVVLEAGWGEGRGSNLEEEMFGDWSKGSGARSGGHRWG